MLQEGKTGFLISMLTQYQLRMSLHKVALMYWLGQNRNIHTRSSFKEHRNTVSGNMERVRQHITMLVSAANNVSYYLLYYTVVFWTCSISRHFFYMYLLPETWWCIGLDKTEIYIRGALSKNTEILSVVTWKDYANISQCLFQQQTMFRILFCTILITVLVSAANNVSYSLLYYTVVFWTCSISWHFFYMYLLPETWLMKSFILLYSGVTPYCDTSSTCIP